MAELLDINESFGVPFQAQLRNRFIMLLDGIPAYVIKTATKPQFVNDEIELDYINIKRFQKGKTVWQPMTMTCYSPIVPSAAQAVMEWARLHHEAETGRDGYQDFYKKDFDINVLGPANDIVELWKIKGAWLQDVNFGDLDWSASDPVEISLTIRYDYAILEF